MANWSGSTMIESSKELLQIVADMEDLNKNLMLAVATYSTAIEDNVKEGTEEMVKKVDALLQSIRKEIEDRANKVGEAGKKITALETDAKNKINSLR